MFEHLKKKKQLKQQLSKVLSIALSVAMLVGTIPADMLGGIADVKAAGDGESTLSASDYALNASNGTITDSNNVFTVTSGVTVKTDDADESDPSKFYFELSGASITFNVAANKKGTLTITKHTTAGDGTLKCDETAVGTTVTDLAAGSHTLTSEGVVNVTSLSLTLANATPDPNPNPDPDPDPDPDPGATVSVTLTGADLLGNDDTIILTPGEGSPVSFTKTQNSITLTKGTEYTLSCSNTKLDVAASGACVLADGKVKATEDNTELAITLTRKTKDVAITIDGTVPENVVIKLHNNTTTTETDIDITTSSTKTLYVGDTYELQTSGTAASTVDVSFSDSDTVKTLTVAADTPATTVYVTKKNGGGGTPKTYSLDFATEELHTKTENNKTIVFGLYNDALFTIGGTVEPKTNGTGDAAINVVELAKNEAGYIEFTVAGTATVTVNASSTSAGNTSWAALLKAEANGTFDVNATENIILDDGTNGEAKVKFTDLDKTELVYSNLASGTYRLVSPKKDKKGLTTYYPTGENIQNADKPDGRGVRILDIKVEDSATRTERKTLTTTDAPVISTPAVNAEDLNMVDVSVKGLVDYDGGDYVEVTMNLKDGAAADAVTKKDYALGEDHAVSFDMTASGTYVFSAALVRGTDKVAAAENKELEFKYGLPAPTKLKAKNVGEGKLEIKWGAVTGATGYSLKIVDKADSTKTVTKEVTEATYTTTTDDELEVEHTYSISVASKNAKGTYEYSDPIEKKLTAEADVEVLYWPIDLTAGLFKAEEYVDGDLTVLDDMPYKGNKDTIDGVEYPRVQGSVNPDPKGGSIPIKGAVVKLAASKNGKFTIACSTADKKLHFIDVVNGAVVNNALSALAANQTKAAIYKFDVQEGHTYYFYGDSTKVNLCALIVDYRDITEVAWSDIADPVLTSAEFDADDPTKVIVKAKGQVGTTTTAPTTAYADALRVDMTDSAGKVVQSLTDRSANLDADNLEDKEFEFTLGASGKYTFTAYLVRSGETDKVSANKPEKDFILPLAVPEKVAVTNAGGGFIKVTWETVKEATKYTIKIEDKDDSTVVKTLVVDDGTAEEYTTSADADKLTIGKTYLVSVCAHRDEEDGAWSDAKQITITEEAYVQLLWNIDLTGKNAAGDKQGLFTSKTYAGGDLTVLNDMIYKGVTDTINDVKYPRVQGDKDPSPNKGAIPTSGAAVKLAASKDGKFTIACSTTDTSKTLHFIDVVDDVVVDDALNKVQSKATIYKFDVQAGHTYYFYGDGTKVNLCALIVDYRTIDKYPWSDIPVPAKPVATWPTPIPTENEEDEAKFDKNTITVTSKGLVGISEDPLAAYADVLRIDMLNSKGDVVASLTNDTENTDKDNLVDQTFKFEPTATDSYTFVPYLVRSGEEDKRGEESDPIAFELPLAAPVIASVTNKGSDGEKNKIEVVWSKVAGARSYEVKVYDNSDTEAKGTTLAGPVSTTALKEIISGLNLGKVTVGVVAINGENRSAEATKDLEITGSTDATWAYASFGPGAKADDAMGDNGYKIGDNGISLEQTGGTLDLWSRNKQGKILPGSTDGLAYYYTTIDPNDNFIIEADIHVDSWEYSNGQEGFGIMAADRVGVNGDRRAFWNNSYQLLSSKIQYKYNLETCEEVSGSDAKLLRYDMQNGLGWTSKLGTTITDVAKIDTGEMDVPTNFVSTSGTLETSMLDAVYTGDGAGEVDANEKTHYPRGTYNLIGNRSVEAGKESHPTIANGGNGIVDFKLRMVRTDSGYYLTYITTPADSTNGVEEVSRTQFFADANRSSLAMIDKKNVYLGFFASRNVTIKVSNVHLTTGKDIDVSAYEKPVEAAKIDPDYQVTSSEFSNSRNYDLIFKANADGKLNITDSNNKVIASDVEVTAGKVCTFTTRLSEGTTEYTVKFEPNKDYKSSAGLELKNYDPVTIPHFVTYRAMSGSYIYAAPDGTAEGAGTSESPVDVRTAIAYAAPGQTIRLKAGNYMLGKGTIGDAISIDKGHNGTPKKPITMEADPAAATRPVLDFAGQFDSKSAFVIAGDYWRFKGFDVTNSKDGEKAIQLSGDYNILEDLHTYRNGNTGIQISRLGSEGRADWPSYNKVVNCTSYLNADSGYEDADGFAAKLTVGEGNEFIGCIAAYNADDGWDLYAKVEDGSIGAVTIDRCIAFKNGYDIVETAPIDSKKLVEEVQTGNGTLYVVNAGNGNGFKLGGESMSGYHVLKNSIAFGNKLKGIDCNSCPDIQVFNCTSYKNLGENVSLYTNALNTDYYLDGVISVSGTVADQIKPVGTQNLSKIYSAKNYLYAKGITYRANDKKQSEAKVTIEENGSSVELTAPEWFNSTAMETVVADWKTGTIPGPDSTGITRDTNGNIVMRGFLELKPAVADVLDKGATVGSTDSAIEDEVVINAYAGTVTTLRNISLTAVLDGYSWKYPDTDLTPYVGTSSEFIAVKDGRDRAVTVNLIDITGVELKVYDKDGNEVDINANTVQLGDNKLTLKAVPVVTPAIDLESDAAKSTKATFAYALTEKTKLGLNTTTKNTDESKGVCEAYDVTRKSDAKDGAATITATMTVTLNGTRSKTVKKTASYSFISRKEASKFSYTLGDLTGMTEDDFAFETVPGAKDGETTEPAVNKTIISATADIGDSFTLKDLKVDKLAKPDVKVSVSDSKVLKLTSGTNKFEAKAEGTATITLTAAADKTVSEKILVNVRGAEIKLNASMITLDQAKYTGTQITATPLADITLTGDIKVEEAKLGNNDKASDFTLKRINGNIYSLIVGKGEKAGTREDSTTIANGTYKVRLSGTYTVGTGESAVTKTALSDELLVRVMTTRPTVSIRQQKRVNIFYKYNAADAAGTLTATSKLAKITLDTTAKAGDDFELTYSGGSYTVTMKKSGQDKLEANNLRPNTLNKRITTTASFGGYKSTYDQPVTINVATERRLPNLIVEADNNTLYTKLGIKDTEIRIFNKTNKTYLTGADVTLANSTRAFERANKDFWLEEVAGAYVLTTTKSGTAKISVKDADWNEEIVLNQRLTLNDRTAPRPTFSAAKLNSGADYVGKEQASSVVTIRGILDYKIRDLELTARANTPAAKLLPALVYDSEIEADEYGNHLLNISLDEEKFNAISPKITRGSFTYTANFRLNNLKDQTANVTVTILPVESITMNARQSGKIDLLNRAGTAVTVKPVMKNLNGTVSGMYFKDDAHNQFNVAWDSAKGAAIVTAKEFAEFRQSGRYKVTPVFEVWTNNGKVEIEAARPIFITTTQSSVKTTSIPLLEMRLADPSATAQATLAPKSAAEILDVTQVTNLQNFKVEYDAQGDIVSVQIIDRKGLKAGSTYQIAVELQLEGSAVNAKPQKVNIPVKVLY